MVVEPDPGPSAPPFEASVIGFGPSAPPFLSSAGLEASAPAFEGDVMVSAPPLDVVDGDQDVGLAEEREEATGRTRE